MNPTIPGKRQQLKLVEIGNVGVLAGSLGTFAQHLGRLVATKSSTPLTALILVLVGATQGQNDQRQLINSRAMMVFSQISLGGADQGSEFPLILALDILESYDSSGLLVHDRAEASFALDDDIGHAHLAAKGGEEDDELDGVDVVCNDDE
jgi:hypothetical protein